MESQTSSDMSPGPSTESSTFTTRGQEDDRVVAEQIISEYANHVVPVQRRISRWSLFSGWSAMSSAMAWVFYGALAASLAGVEQAMIGMVVAAVAHSVLSAISLKRGVNWGLNSLLIARELFGWRGAALAPAIILVVIIYFAAFESTVMAVALQSFFGVGDVRIWYAIVVVGMTPLMLGGMQTWFNKLNAWTLPIYFFGIIAAVIVAGFRFGWEGDFSAFEVHNTGGIPGWLTVFMLYVGVWAMIPDCQDIARFGRKEDLKFHQNVTFGAIFTLITFLFNGVAGILLAGLALSGGALSESGVVDGVVRSLGVIGLIVIIVSQLRINSGNFYLASINWERLVGVFTTRNLKRTHWVLLTSGIVFISMFFNLLSHVGVIMAWIGVFTVSWVGMMIVHLLIHGNNVPEFRPARLHAFAPGFLVWMLATAAGIIALQLPQQFPLLSALAPLVSLAISVVLYLAMHFAGLSALKKLPSDPIREQIIDQWNTWVECKSCERSYVTFEMDVATNDASQPLCLDCQGRTITTA